MVKITNEQGGSQSAIDGRYDLVPALALLEIAKVVEYGATEYGELNWEKISPLDHINHALAHTHHATDIILHGSGDYMTELTHAATRLMFAIDRLKRK